MAKRLRRESDKPVNVPSHFVPQFWAEADQRCAVVKEIRRRYDELKNHTATESAQKDLLCQRATFIAIQLETMECVAAESGRFDAGIYTQMSNALLGLLKALGLERQTTKVVNLQSYVKERTT